MTGRAAIRILKAMADIEFFPPNTTLPASGYALPLAADPNPPENARYLIAESGTIQNQKVGMQAVGTFADPLPAFGTIVPPGPQTWRLHLVVLRLMQDTWVEIIGTASGWAKDSHGGTRILTVSPATPGDIDGVEFWSPGSQNIRQLDKNGRVSFPMKAQVWLEELEPGGAGSFQSASVHFFGETFDA